MVILEYKIKDYILEKRRLGRTNHFSTVISLGAYVLKYLSQDDADDAIQVCLDYGINHIDVAPKYDEESGEDKLNQE